MKRGLIFAALVAAAPGAANADPRDDALAAMARCAALTERAARLGCFDATIARVPALGRPDDPRRVPLSAVAPPFPASPMPPAAPPRRRSSGFMASLFGSGPKRRVQTSVAEFGSESIANAGARAYPIPMDGDTVDQISARVAAVRYDAGFLSVTLDNGQVWRQTAGADAVGSLSRPAVSYVAIIARGSFAGSYAMRLSGRAGEIAVRRIR